MVLESLPEGEREQGRIEVLPVQWRKHLNLGVRLQPASQLPRFYYALGSDRAKIAS